MVTSPILLNAYLNFINKPVQVNVSTISNLGVKHDRKKIEGEQYSSVSIHAI